MTLPHFTGQVAIVTGGSRGIGRAVALAFAEEGCVIGLIARSAEKLVQTRKEIEQSTAVPVETFPVDVSDAAAVKNAADKMYSRFGRIDILVNAAGAITPIGRLEECDPAAWAQVIQTNLVGTFHAMRAVLPAMKRVGRGTIINFSGGGALNPFPRFSAYSASKAAIVRLTETAAEETRDFGITVNAIAPGAINTDMFEEILHAPPENLEQRQRAEFLARKEKGGDPVERVCRLALFLASPEALVISGKVISAHWDPWESLPDHSEELRQSDIYTLRRITPKDRGRNW